MHKSSPSKIIKPRKAPTIGFTVEILSVVIRAGANHEKLGDPFDFAVVVSSVDGRTGIIKALNKDAGADFKPGHSKAILRGVRSLGLKPDWIRMVPGRQKRRHKRAAPKPSL